MWAANERVTSQEQATEIKIFLCYEQSFLQAAGSRGEYRGFVCLARLCTATTTVLYEVSGCNIIFLVSLFSSPLYNCSASQLNARMP